MLKYQNKKFYVTRGDGGQISIPIDNYTLKENEVAQLRVYEKEGLDQEPKLVKDGTNDIATNSVVVDFLSADTLIGDPTNEVIEYWYEIKIGGEKTVICFDESGAKLFYLYPGGQDKK